MQYFKLIIAYDGTRYHGWQFQPDDITVSKMLQDRFKAVFKKEIKLIGASRTDAGVHALGQVANFSTDLDLDPNRLKSAWSNLLPVDILVRKLELVDINFHPQAQVAQKTYYYHIFEKRPIPFISNYGFYPKQWFDIAKFHDALSIFTGTHDFRSFCTGYDAESTVRTIDSIHIKYFKRYGIYQVQIKGQSFLRYMIRRVVGAALDIASSPKRHKEELHAALCQKDPQQHFTTAPAHGLMLYRIVYK